MDVGMLGLIYSGVRDRIFELRVLGRNISLFALIWGT